MKVDSKPRKTMAARADRHVLYEKAVQDSAWEYEFLDRTFRERRGRRAQLLREDFCGTANMCCEWVRRRRDNRAIGVDIDAEVLAWGEAHNVAELTPAMKRRLTLMQQDVRKVQTEPVDIVVAMNFSYQCFKDRDMLRRYFRQARKSLVEDGLLILDAFGGYDAFRELKEHTDHKGFTYVWDQSRYDPVTGELLCHIHFGFPDGSKLKNAFTYDWRLWTLPELREVLLEAGFSTVTVYWQQTDPKTGEFNNVFKPAESGDADAGWIAYVCAER